METNSLKTTFIVKGLLSLTILLLNTFHLFSANVDCFNSEPTNPIKSFQKLNLEKNELVISWDSKDFVYCENVKLEIFQPGHTGFKLNSTFQCKNTGEFRINVNESNLNLEMDIVYRFAYVDKAGKALFSNPILFNPIPECLKPTGGKIIAFDNGRYQIRWDSILDNPKSYYYKLKVINQTENEPTVYLENELHNKNSFELKNLDNTQNYQIFVQRICLEDAGNLKFYSDWAYVGIIKGNANARSITCGETVNIIRCGENNSGPFNYPNLHLQGYTIEVTSFSTTQDAFSGTGTMYLPFLNRYLAVEWYSPKAIDTSGNICQGWVKGISDALKTNLYSGNMSEGGAICVKPESEEDWGDDGINKNTSELWDDFGFDQGGNYIKPPYDGDNPPEPFDNHFDPNGFDKDGNYLNTGSQYNPAGCNRLGFDAQGQPCNPAISGPYFWLQSNPNGPTTTAGEEFFNEIGNQKLDDDFIRPRIEFLEDELQTDVLSKTPVCNAVRVELNNMFSAYNTSLPVGEQINRDYIFGDNDQYFVEGMHKNFTSKIYKNSTTLSGAIPNSTQIFQDLESKHVDLYDCDLELGKLKLKHQIIADILNDATKYKKIADVIKDKIKHFTEAEATKYKDPTAFEEWLYALVDKLCNQEIDDAIKEIYGFQDFNTGHDDSRIGFVKTKSNDEFIWNSPAIASVTDGYEFKFKNGISLEAINEEYLSGAKNIWCR